MTDATRTNSNDAIKMVTLESLVYRIYLISFLSFGCRRRRCRRPFNKPLTAILLDVCSFERQRNKSDNKIYIFKLFLAEHFWLKFNFCGMKI